MKRIGIIGNEIDFPNYRSQDELFKLCDANTGNLVFLDALKQILHGTMIPRMLMKTPGIIDPEDFKAFVLVDLIWIRPNVNLGYLQKILDNIGDKPLIPISIGLHTTKYDSNFQLHPETLKLLHNIAERCEMGVRGEYTANILAANGIKNIRVVGCPSMYKGMDESFRITKKPFAEVQKVVSNSYTLYTNMAKFLEDFLVWCAGKGLDFVEQTNRFLSPDYCSSTDRYNYLNGWMTRKLQVFFNVPQWETWIRQFDFSIGSRFHGNVVALQNGVPALFMTGDSRMNEMCEHFRLPTIAMKEFNTKKDIEYYYDLADYEEFNASYRQRLNNFSDFLKKNNIYRTKDDPWDPELDVFGISALPAQDQILKLSKMYVSSMSEIDILRKQITKLSGTLNELLLEYHGE